MKHRYLSLTLLALILTVFSCGKGKGPASQTKDEKQPVTVEELTLRELDDFITVSGKLEGITDITMSSETSGRVLQVYKKLGDQVSRGDRIGRVDNSAIQYRLDQAEAAVASAQASFDNAQRNLDYAETSLQRNLISAAEYNIALTGFKAAKAALDGAKAGLETAQNGVSGSYFTAPESGVISNLNIMAGQFINAGAPVATITDARRLIVKTGVGETQIGKLRTGQRVEVSYPGMEETLSGTIRGFGIRPLAGSATYPVEIEIANPRSLLPGMVVSARILTTRYTDLLFSSITNFSKEFDKTYAFVIDSDGKARKREVSISQVIGEYGVIASGLEAGERIVTSGAENLEDGSPVEIRK